MCKGIRKRAAEQCSPSKTNAALQHTTETAAGTPGQEKAHCQGGDGKHTNVLILVPMEAEGLAGAQDDGDAMTVYFEYSAKNIDNSSIYQ